MTTSFDALIARLERTPGVSQAMLVGLDDGLIVAGASSAASETAAALAASIYRRAGKAADEAGLGAARFVRLEAEGGHVCATPAGELVLVALAGAGSNVGRLRIEMLREAERL